MSNVRIGPDGSIIRDDITLENRSRTIIREDGTIETTDIARNVPVINRRSAPVSPLVMPSPSVAAVASGVDRRAIAEKEYDIQMQEARVRNAFSKKTLIIAIVLCVLGAAGIYVLFIPAGVAGVMVLAGLGKRSRLEAERKQMNMELEKLKNGVGL